ncbi:hypothetical protein [Flavobacterium pectinovorum]|uniref:Uncharacterized protein n=1 Tax=Flavobacterium pectinovorum TaxID=29533 RepID=A0A502F798_9FLAO|nr:hypothetical protein [Flavobacterium pectinovorum]TPG45232.1 hypothetical protein EAH81_01110 [Flavobacterium pectinovorum]
MCETGKEIKLCTCVPNGIDKIVHNKKSRRFKHLRKEYTWTLEKYIGGTDFTMDGMIIFPNDSLSEDLTNESMLIVLNNRHSFDFNYEPKEGDNLQVFGPQSDFRKFLSFIYRNEKWITDYYDGFKDKTEKINYGTVTIEDKTENKND